MPLIFVTNDLKGLATPADFLREYGGFEFRLLNYPPDSIGMFFVLDDDFLFSLHYHNSGFELRRNQYRVFLPATTDKDLSHLPPDRRHPEFKVHWNANELILSCRIGQEIREERTRTSPTKAPESLKKWAKKLNLLETIEYDSEEAFRFRVYSCLESIEDKISEVKDVNAFWDIRRKGNAIISRTPRRETDIHDIIELMLKDQMLMANIEVIPESQTGVGNLDFLFLAQVKNKGICGLCVEFKNAHSDDLEHGMNVQLPLHMQSRKSQYGAYCVLWYKGLWFNSPDDNSADDLHNKLQRQCIESRSPTMHGIRVFVYDLAKHQPASKEKGIKQDSRTRARK